MVGVVAETGDVPFLASGNGNGNKMNLRIEILENLLNASGDGTSAKVNSLRQAIHRSKTDMAESLSDSLDLVRQVFQHEITMDLKVVMDRHWRTTFQPALENLKRNGFHEIPEEIKSELFLSILDGAKEQFSSTQVKDGNKYCMPSAGVLKSRKQEHSPERKAYESDDNESDTSMASHSTYRTSTGINSKHYNSENRPKKRGRPRKVDVDTGRSGTPLMMGTSPVSFKELCKWNGDRITPDTKFVLGYKVNKLLNMGHRGHIFAKYPRIFRYVCDDEDKAWMFDRNISTRMSGKVFFMVLEDVLEVAHVESAPSSVLSDLCRYAFNVPERTIYKMKKCMAKLYEQLKGRATTSSTPLVSPNLNLVQNPLASLNNPLNQAFNSNLTAEAMNNLLLGQSGLQGNFLSETVNKNFGYNN